MTVKSNVTLEHLGGTDMAYGIDNLTNGKGTSAVTTIDGGTVKSTYRAIRQFLNGVEATNTLTINGGTVTGTNKAIFFQDPSKNANSGKLTIGANADINGGVYLFVTEGSTQWPVEVSIAAAALDEAGVTYKNVPNGYDVANIGGTYGVYTGVAKVGNTYYSNLKDAVAADGEVVLVANVSVEDVNGIEITKKVSIDLNGKTVSFNGDGFVVNGGALTVTGEGNVTAANTAGNYVALWAKSGTAVINGGTWSMANLDTTGEGNSLIYTYDGVVTINDGYFQSKNTYNNYGKPWYYVLNRKNDKTGTITVYGGTYENYDPAAGDDVLQIPPHLAEGHKSVNVGSDTYAVHKHGLVFKQGHPATCEDPAVFYKSCEYCGVKHNTETFDTGVLGDHKLTHHDEIPAGSNSFGTEEHWTCSVCEGIFLDAEGNDLVGSEDALVIYPDNYAGPVEKIVGALTEGVVKDITVKRDEQAYYSFTPAADGDYLFYLPYEDSPALWFYETNEAGMFNIDSSEFLENGINEGHVLTLKAGTKYVACVSGAIEPYPATVQTSICVVKNGTVTGIAFREATVELFAGMETASAAVVELPVGETIKDVTYTSSDPAIASIIKNGLGESMISANKPGTATITATTADGRTATCKVISKPVPELKVGSVEPMKIPSIAGQFYTFKVPADGTYSLYWTKSAGLEVSGYAVDMSQTPPTGSELVGKPIAAEGKYGFTYELKAGLDCTIILINNTENAVDDTIYLTVDSHTCKLTKVPAKEATYTEDGNIEYYACAACDKRFYDAEGKKVITGSVILPQLIEVVGDKAEVSTGAVDKAIEEAATSGDKKDVVLDLTHEEVVGEVAKPVTKTEIPVAAIEKVAEAEASLTLTKEDATVTLDTKALETVAEAVKKEGAVKVIVAVKDVETKELTVKQQEAVKVIAEEKKVAKVISAELLVQTAAGEKKICTEGEGGFGGGTVTVKIPFTPETGFKGTDYSVIYVADDGSTKEIPTAFKDGCLVVELEHFSDYVIVNKATNAGGNGCTGEAKPTEPTKPATKPGKPAPNTGDNANIFGLFAMLMVSGLLATALLVFKKKARA